MIGIRFFLLFKKYIIKNMNNSESKNKVTNLAVVCAYFYPKIGGLETIAYTTAKMLHKSGKYRVSIITSNYDGVGYKKEIIDGMTVHRLPISFKLSNSPVNIFWYRDIKKILKQEEIDLVHTHSPVPYMADVAVRAAKSLGIPTVATYHSGSMKKGKFLIDVVIRLYEQFFLRKLFKLATRVVTVHQVFMRTNYPEVAYKTSFIPTGVDLDRFSNTPVPAETKKVTFIGRIELSSKWKGIEQLLQAMVIVLKSEPSAILELVGGGDALDMYRNRAKELGIENNVEINGPKYANELVEVYKNTTVVVLPSTSDSEAFSVTLVEAMASGRPIIGTKMGGTPQVITDGENGLLVPAKDPKALAQAILRVISDHDFASRLGSNGAVMSKNFSWDIQTEKYTKLFEEILGK
jgi:glycosyltransferase involved in cell wall biosynthesis